MREDKFMKRQQQGPTVPNLDSVKTAKSFIPDKYNNRMELNKLKRMKYFTKALLDLIGRVFSEQEVGSCFNIKSAVEKLILWHESLSTYREGDAMYIEFKTEHPDIVGKW